MPAALWPVRRNAMNEVRIDEDALFQMKNAGSYMWSLIGYCDALQGRMRAKIKRKFQLAYNKGYDDGIIIRKVHWNNV